MTVRYLVLAASMVGNQYDECYYTRLADDILRSFNRRFVDPETGQYGSGSQCAMLYRFFWVWREGTMGIESLKPVYRRGCVCSGHLLEDIAAHGNRLTTGDVGNRYLIQALARSGRDEVVYRMFNHEEAPDTDFSLSSVLRR